ncbi:hypothetical protein [Romboutsia sp.]|uniref:hypothetical protein n=1 Tax=Romboutsia sp. TaxID=1965302 RepID=UPI003F3582D6
MEILIVLAFFNYNEIIFILIKDKQLADLSYRFAYVFILALPIIAPFFELDNYLRLCGKANMSMGKIALLLGAPSYLFNWFTMTVVKFIFT